MKVKVPVTCSVELRLESADRSFEVMSESVNCGEVEVEIPGKYLEILRLIPWAKVVIKAGGIEEVGGGGR